MNIGKTRYEITHNVAAYVFAVVGTAWWLIPMLGSEHAGHMDHMEHVNQVVNHGPTFLGFNEMTWMWYVMALVHFFIHDCMKFCTGCEERLKK